MVVALFLLVAGASATTISVCPGGCDYTSIQAAIDVANPRDAIEVHSGTYREIVVVNKQLTLTGLDTGSGIPIVDAGGSGSAITLSADGITLDGVEAINAGGINPAWNAGIKVTSNYNILKICNPGI